jgi:hypothetical protein
MITSVTNPPPMYMISLPFRIGGGPPLVVTAVPQHRKQKKPTWRNTQRYSTTSAYSSTSLPLQADCSLSSHPTTLVESRDKMHRILPTAIIVRRQGAKAIEQFAEDLGGDEQVGLRGRLPVQLQRAFGSAFSIRPWMTALAPPENAEKFIKLLPVLPTKKQERPTGSKSRMDLSSLEEKLASRLVGRSWNRIRRRRHRLPNR